MKEKKRNKKKMVSLAIDSKLYKTFQRVIQSCAVDECRLVFTSTGIDIKVVDPSNVAMSWTVLEPEMLEQYTLVEDFEVGWSFKDAKKVGLMESYNKGSVQIDIFEVDGITEESGYRCEITHDIFNSIISLPASDSIRREPKIPEMKLNCVFNIDKNTMRKVLRVTHKVINRNEYIAVTTEKSSVVFSDEKEDPTWTTTKIPIKSNEIGKSLYSTQYLIDFIKSLPDKSVIKFCFASDKPCILSCEIVEGLTVTYLLAPRIESD